MVDPFPSDYRQARSDFLRAAEAAGAALRTHTLPGHHGPDGGELGVDTAYLGPAEPQKLLVVVSGTHGIEGFCGSACQTHVLLGEGIGREAARNGNGVLLVHALNPYGFAYLRRVNEDNIDLNRNFVDHTAPPHNDPYDLVHDTLVPTDTAVFSAASVGAAMLGELDRLGYRTLQQAVTQGQYRHADGLFYGGAAPTWSSRVLRTIVAEQIASVPHVAYIDVHTGLGERGVGEPIFRGGRDPDAFARTRRWYGDAVTDSDHGTSSSTPIVGNTATAVADGLEQGEELTAITLEFGTLPGTDVLLALCADNWLHLRSTGPEAMSSELKRLIVNAFGPRDVLWQKQVLSRAGEVFQQALAGLAAAGQPHSE